MFKLINLKIMRSGLFIALLTAAFLAVAFSVDPKATGDLRVVYELLEETKARTFIGNVSYDAYRKRLLPPREPSSALPMFQLTGPDPRLQFFDLSDSGLLETKKSFDREEFCSSLAECLIEMNVIVKSAETHFIKVYVRILDVNDNAPRFPQEHLSLRLPESTQPGLSQPISGARDNDGPQNGVKRYELVAVSPAAKDKFELHGRNNTDGSVELKLAVLQQLDREKEDFYRLKVIAYDGGKPTLSGTMIIEITVSDVNDNSPQFDRPAYEVEVYENRPVNSTLLRVKATDPDIGLNGIIVYSWTPKSQTAYGDLFHITAQTGEIRLLKPLDYERQKAYQLSLIAQNQGDDLVPTHCKVTIIVADINDNPPIVTIHSPVQDPILHIQEHSELGSFVAHVSVSDADSGSNGRTSCFLRPAREFVLEQLYDTEYKIVTGAMLDREVQETYELTLQCADQGTPELTTIAVVIVKVTDINDHSPIFSESTYNVQIRENNRANDYIVRVSASDLDIGRNAEIVYEPVTDVGINSFNIDSRSGIITTNDVFNREATSVYTLRVRARDRGAEPRSSTATVIVNVLDEDDQPPMFSQRNFRFEVTENEESKFELGSLIADDADLPPNDKFFFYFDSPHDIGDVFAINHATGAIFTKKPLDREEKDVYQITAVVKSNAVSHMTDTAQVTISVKDVNDNSPYFMYPSEKNETVYLSNKCPLLHVVCAVQALDKDIDDNGLLSFEISPQTFHEEFAIDASSGQIFVNSDLSLINHGVYPLEIIAYDHGSPQKSSRASITLVISRDIRFTAGQSSLAASSSLSGRQFILSPFHLIVIACVVFALIVILILLVALGIGCRSRRHYSNNRRHQTKSQQNNCNVLISPHEMALTKSDDFDMDYVGSSDPYAPLDQDLHEASLTPPSVGHGEHETDSGIECQGGGEAEVYALRQQTSSGGSRVMGVLGGSLKRQRSTDVPPPPYVCQSSATLSSPSHYPPQQQQQQHQQRSMSPACLQWQASGQTSPPIPPSFTDWLHAENFNLQQRGNMYRIDNNGSSGASSGGGGVKKSVRFEPPVFRYDADGLSRLPPPASWEQDENGLFTLVDSPPSCSELADLATYPKRRSSPSQPSSVSGVHAGTLHMAPVSPAINRPPSRSSNNYATLPTSHPLSMHTFT